MFYSLANVALAVDYYNDDNGWMVQIIFLWHKFNYIQEAKVTCDALLSMTQNLFYSDKKKSTEM